MKPRFLFLFLIVSLLFGRGVRFGETVSGDLLPGVNAGVLLPIAAGAVGKLSPSQDKFAARRGSRKLALYKSAARKAPEMLARIDGRKLVPLPFIAHDVSVIIVGHRVRVVHDMVFRNPARRQLSGRMMIELSNGASPVYLSMFQGKGLEDPEDPEDPRQKSISWFNPNPPGALACLSALSAGGQPAHARFRGVVR